MDPALRDELAALWTPEDDEGLDLPNALSHQAPILDADYRFKVWRAGRRGGKSRGALIAGTKGHGPDKKYRGMLQGADILWLAPDYPQSAAIWREEIRPRFAGLPGYEIHETQRRVTRLAGGSLELRSAESIDNVRGRRFHGAIVDEGAYLDLEYAWTAVIRPALADYSGWAMFISTTNAGPDGNSLKRTPSYFNMLAQRVEAGALGADWHGWHTRTEDNPSLSPVEVAAMRAEYPPDSPTVQQELDALLVAGGVLAFGELRWETVRVDLFPPPPTWTLFGAFDWGYWHPYAFGLFAAAEDGGVYLLDSCHGRKLQPIAIAEQVSALLEKHGKVFRDLRYTVAGGDVFDERKARGEYGPTMQEQFVAQGWGMVRGDARRVMGVQNLRKYVMGETPRFRICDTQANRHAFDCIASRVSDPNNPEDVLKQDADTNGFGGDDPYDMVRYGLMSKPIIGAQPVPVEVKQEDRARSYDYGQKRQMPVGATLAEIKQLEQEKRTTLTRPITIPRFRGGR